MYMYMMLNKINAKTTDMMLKKNRDKKKVKYNRLGLKMLIIYLGSILFLIMMSMPSILGDAGLPSVSISQIYLNTTDLNLSSADPNFSVPVPPNYTISESLFSFENVSMEPYTMGFETDTSHIDGFCYASGQIDLNSAVLAIPFQVPMDCKVSQISFYVKNEDSSNTKYTRYYISAAKWDNNSLQIDRTTGSEWGDLIPKSFEGWYPLNGSYILNNSETYNNTWFVAITINYYPQPGAVAYRLDNAQGDNNNQFNVFNCSTDTSGHLIAINDLRIENGSTIDLFAKIRLRSVLDNSTIQPSYLHLKLNNTQIDDAGNISVNEGLKIDNTTEQLNYKLSSDWYNFSCILANRYIKFTREMNVLNIPLSELGVTTGHKLGFTISDSDFGSQFINHSVQIAIPNIWEITSVKQGGASTSYNIEEYSDRKIVNIEGATPGYWELIATDPTNKTKAVLTKVGVYGGIIGGIVVISAIAIIKYKAKEEKDLLRYYGTD